MRGADEVQGGRLELASHLGRLGTPDAGVIAVASVQTVGATVPAQGVIGIFTENPVVAIVAK